MQRQQKKNLRLILVLLAIMGVFVGGAFWRLSQAPAADQLARLNTVRFEQSREIIWPDSLLSESGQAFDIDNLQRQWTLVFFGFTHCEDICPATMSLLGQVSKRLSQTRLAEDTRYLMISVDPARDTPERLSMWLQSLAPALQGVTGNIWEIRALARQFGTTFQKEPYSGLEYQLAHSGNIFILGPQLTYPGFIREISSPQQVEQAYRTMRLLHNR